MSDKRRTPAEALAPVELVDRMTAVTIELGQVIARETEALRSRNRQEVESLQAEKTRLANEYALDVRSVQTRKERIARAPAERVARLKPVIIDLDRPPLPNREAPPPWRSVL